MTKQEEELLSKIHASSYRMLDALDDVCTRNDIPYFLAYGGLLGAVRHHDFIPWDDDVDVIMFPKDFRRLCQVVDQLPADFRFVLPEDYADKYYDMVPRITDTTLEILQEDSRVKQFYQNGLRDYAALDIFLLARQPKGLLGWWYKFQLKMWYAMAGAHRCPSLSKITGGALYFVRKMLETVGRCFTAEQIRRKCMALIERYQDRTDYDLFTANGSMLGMVQIYPCDSFSEVIRMPMNGHEYNAPKKYDKILRIQYGDYMKLPPEEERQPHLIDK